MNSERWYYKGRGKYSSVDVVFDCMRVLKKTHRYFFKSGGYKVARESLKPSPGVTAVCCLHGGITVFKDLSLNQMKRKETKKGFWLHLSMRLRAGDVKVHVFFLTETTEDIK